MDTNTEIPFLAIELLPNTGTFGNQILHEIKTKQQYKIYCSIFLAIFNPFIHNIIK